MKTLGQELKEKLENIRTEIEKLEKKLDLIIQK